MSLLDGLTKSLIDVYANKLSEQQKNEVLQCLEVLANDKKYNKFKNFFPDEGEFHRGLYPRHCEFFQAGKSYRFRGFIAGNRCITPWTFIQTDSGVRPSLEVLCEKDSTVLSWDGVAPRTAKTSDGILKGIEPAFRVVMDNGEFFDCTRKHQVLTSFGFVHIDQLMSLSSGLRLKKRREDYQASCVEDGYLCGQQLPAQSDSGQGQVPLQDDVQGHAHLVWSQKDVEGRIPTHIQTLQFPVPLSTQDDLSRYADLFSLFSASKTDTHVLPLSDCTKEVHRLVVELASLVQSANEQQHGKYSFLSYHDQLMSLYHDALNSSEVSDDLVQVFRQFEMLPSLELEDQEFADDNSHISIFYPLSHPPLVGGKRIVCILPIGYQPIIDVTVGNYKCYFSAGVVHHNTGKSEAGSYETVCHATGDYPHWWDGLRFSRPVLIWVGGDTATTLRDIVQKKLVGEISDVGSGMIPKDAIVEYKTRRNVPDAIETIRVKHLSGGVSTIVLKSYEQGRISWQGSEVDFIWLDEEPPQEVFGEASIRLMTTNGSLIMTFTPLSGVTDVVMDFLDNDQHSDNKFPRWVTVCGWKDVPHITEEMKEQMLASTPPQLREARSEGKPTVGSGLIYPIDPKNIVVDDFKIPMHYKRLYGMDVGWNATAALWGAWDMDNDVIYIYSEYKRGGEEGMDMPLIHSTAIKARGEWIKGIIDPASRGRSQADGEQLYMTYQKHGLKIMPADNAVEAGIYKVWERLNTGKLKIFKSCTGLLREFSLYHRDEKGKIVKNNDHLLDCGRYLLSADPACWSYPSSPASERSKVVNMSQYMSACT